MRFEYLEKIKEPKNIKPYKIDDLYCLADDIRKCILDVTSKKGGHVAPNLGMVEATIALHYVFNAPEDKFIFDVGHQCYPHKLLTGRYERFETLRQKDGISGYPFQSESEYDIYGTGHAGTSISTALGWAITRDKKNEDYEVIAVIGDGSLTGGVAFEGLNFAGYARTNMKIIFNDNDRSIAKNVGGLSLGTSRLNSRVIDSNALIHRNYLDIRQKLHYLFDYFDKKDEKKKIVEDIRKKFLRLLTPATFFESLGITYLDKKDENSYYGSRPIDGHNIEEMIETFEHSKKINGPVLIHIKTEKGHNYEPAIAKEEFHGRGPFHLERNKIIYNKKWRNYNGKKSANL